MEQIGRYEISSELGRGAMGIVYRARDPKIGREVAIKTIKLADQADADEIENLRERLFREAQSAGRLSHPGIVTIFDVDEEDGLAYITMELVEGKTLDRYVADDGGTARSLEFVADLLAKIGSALDYAHRREIVHRDIKPSNIMISDDGIKVMDFGVARIASSNLTRTGTVMGTPNYMSPEQVKGESIDGRSDQFSLGVIIYELLTGKKPFQAENLTSTIFKIVSAEPVRPRQLNPKLSPALDDAVVRSLSKSCEQRFDTCSAFADAFADAARRIRSGEETVVLTAGLPELGDGDETAGEIPAQQDVTHAQTQSEMTPATASVAKTEEFSVSDETAEKRLPVKGVAAEPAEAKAEKAAAKESASARAEPAQPEVDETTPILPEPTRKMRAAEFGLGLAGSEGTLSSYGAEPEKKRRWPLLILLSLLVAMGGLTFVLVNNPELLENPDQLLQAILRPAPIPQVEVHEPAEDPQTPATDALPLLEPELMPGAGPDATGSAAESSDGSDPEPAAVEAEPDTAPVEPEVIPPPRPPAARPQPVTFAGNIAGAQIVVDRKTEWTCTAPCEPMELPRGQHTATITLDGYRAQRKSFDVEREPLRVSYSLQPIQATLVISSLPSGGDIYVDGRKTGQTTTARVLVMPGEHVVRVVKGDLAAEKTVEIAGDDLRQLGFTLGNQ